MKHHITSSLIALTLSSFTVSQATAQTPAPIEANTKNAKAPYLSLRLEIENAIKTGNLYLKDSQNEAGYWKDDTVPSYTSLAITAAMRSPNLEAGKTPEHIKNAYKWLLSTQKEYGAIYVKGLATYNTSTCLLYTSPSPRD